MATMHARQLMMLGHRLQLRLQEGMHALANDVLITACTCLIVGLSAPRWHAISAILHGTVSICRQFSTMAATDHSLLLLLVGGTSPLSMLDRWYYKNA